MLRRSNWLAGRTLGLISAAVCLTWGCDEAAPKAEHRALSVVLVRETPLFSQIAEDEVIDAEWASDSTLFLSVARGKELLLVAWNGRVSTRVASEGRGPGEVIGAMWLLRRGDSALVSVDILQPRVSWWSINGELLHESNPELPFITGAWSTRDGIVVRVARPRHFTYTWLDDSGRVGANTAFPSERNSAGTSCGYCPSAVSENHRIAMAVSDTTYRFLISNRAGDSLANVSRESIPRVRLSPAQLDSVREDAEALQALFERTRASEATRERFRSRTHPEYATRFISRSVRYDERQWLWVQRSVYSGDSAEIDVFDESSDYFGTVRLPPGTVLRRVSSGRLLITHTNGDSRTVVREYRTGW